MAEPARPSRPLKITFVTINYAPSVGGAQLLTQRLAEGLHDKHHHHVEVITTDALRPPAASDPGRVERTHEVIGGVPVHRYPVARRTHGLLRVLRRLRARVAPRHAPADVQAGPITVGPLGLRLALGVRRACGTSDVVVGIAAPYFTLVGTGLVPRRFVRAKRIGMPLLHHSDTAVHRPIVGRALRHYDTVVALTPFEAREFEGFGVDRAHVETVPPGCDAAPDTQTPTQARAALGLPERPTVGYVGRFAMQKGIDTVLAAAPLILDRHPETTVLLAGAPMGWAGFDPLRDRARREIGDRLVIREDFAESDKALLLAACDVVVTPSREESFGIVTIEAWAAGRPVVAGDIPAVRSLINDGEDGLLIPVGDAPALTRAVGELLADPERARTMGAAGRDRARAEFTWPAVIDRWDELLHRIVGDR